jgi:hypothetical protein
LNRGSTLNVGNFILFRVTGRDAREMAMQFDNSPPKPDDVLKSVPYRSGREGVWRTAGDQVMVKGSSRSYGDVSNETANYLTNVPNYRAYCKLIEGAELAEYFINAEKCSLPIDEAVGKAIKENSQEMAPHRADVQRYINQKFGVPASTNGASANTDGASASTDGKSEDGRTYEATAGP